MINMTTNTTKILNIKKHKIELVKHKKYISWYTAYVKLKGKISPNVYIHETYRSGNTIGIDTMHFLNNEMTIEQQREYALEQIKAVIIEHQKYQRGIKYD